MMTAENKTVQQSASAASNAAGLSVVLGMGATGVSIARWLASSGEEALFLDSREDPPGYDRIHELLPNAELLCGALPPVVPEGVARILLSPGLSMALPLLDDAADRDIPVLSDIDLFMQACHGKVLGVTGSNGKSTVTSLLETMLGAAGVRVCAGGNLGIPALDLLADDAQVYVLELSSFQLERSGKLPLQAAVVLNLPPDHIDHHGDLESYGQAKQRIYACCAKAVVNRDEPGIAGQVSADECASFGLGVPGAGDWGVLEYEGASWVARGTEPVMPVDSLQIAGQHNLANVLAAFALADTLTDELDVPLDGLSAGARLFAGLPHRMQRVASSDGIVWIDDSKATNEAAALASIRSVPGRLLLIAGGDAKGGALDELVAELASRDAQVIVMGKDREFIAGRLQGGCTVDQVAGVEEAVFLAAKVAQPGDTVLLAPACSSLDMYSGFAERGDRFAAAVRSLQS